MDIDPVGTSVDLKLEVQHGFDRFCRFVYIALFPGCHWEVSRASRQVDWINVHNTSASTIRFALAACKI